MRDDSEKKRLCFITNGIFPDRHHQSVTARRFIHSAGELFPGWLPLLSSFIQRFIRLRSPNSFMLALEEISLCIPGYKHLQDIRAVIRFEGDGNYTLVYLNTHPRPLLVSQTLKRFESQLPGFIRISKSDLINPNYVQKVVKKSTKVMHIQILKGPRLLVSRRRMVETLARLDLSTGEDD